MTTSVTVGTICMAHAECNRRGCRVSLTWRGEMITVVLYRQCVQHYLVHVLCTCNITHTVYIHTGIQYHSIVSGHTAAVHYLFYLTHSISHSTTTGLCYVYSNHHRVYSTATLPPHLPPPPTVHIQNPRISQCLVLSVHSPSDQQLGVWLSIVQTASSMVRPLLWPRSSS